MQLYNDDDDDDSVVLIKTVNKDPITVIKKEPSEDLSPKYTPTR